jgi:hypothetical protein
VEDHPDSPDNVEARARHFAWVAVDPDGWIENARMLKAAAEVVLKGARGLNLGMDVSPVYSMLMGFAIESLVKAIVCTIKAPVVTDGKIADVLFGHDTVNLLTQVTHGLTLSDGDKLTLKKLEEYAVWTGRYPTSTKVGATDLSRAISTEDPPTFDALYRRLDLYVVVLAHQKRVGESD